MNKVFQRICMPVSIIATMAVALFIFNCGGGGSGGEGGGDLVESGWELYVYDGTTIAQVADINPGTEDSYPYELVVCNSLLFFRGDDGVNGKELWKFNGVDAPSMVADIHTFDDSSPAALSCISDTLYFRAIDPVRGKGNGELWSSDGSASGTTLEVQIRTDEFGSNPRDMTLYDGYIYLSARDEGGISDYGTELWYYDGANAYLATDISPGGLGSSANILAVYDSTLYLEAADGTAGGHGELFAWDGSSAYMVSDISSVDWEPITTLDAIVFDERLMLSIRDDGANAELWAYNSSSDSFSTWDINPTGPSFPQDFTIYNGDLYFRATDGVNGRELWKYDGVNVPSMVADINTAAGEDGYPEDLAVYDGKLYFRGDDGTNGEELWSYDETNGAQMVEDISSGSLDFYPAGMTVFDGNLYFRAMYNTP